jgi:two-component sensor histidine kinase
VVKKLIISIFFVLFIFSSYSKNENRLKRIDSLINALKLELNEYPTKEDYNFALLTVKLSGLYNRKNQSDSAYAIIEKLLQSTPQLSANKKALLISEKGSYYRRIGRDDKALECFHEADMLLSKVSEPCTKIHHALNKAEFFRKIASFKQSKVELYLAKNLMDKNPICDSTLLIRFYHRMAAVMSESGVDSTVQYSLKSINLSRKLHDLYSEAVSLNELGYYYKNRKLVDTSMQCYLKAESSWKKFGAIEDAVHVMYNRAILISHNNLPKQRSNEILKEIVKIYSHNQIEYPIENVYDLFRDNFYFLGDSANYYRYSIIALKARMYANEYRHETDIRKITEKFKNDSIKAEVNIVSAKLKATNKALNERNTENERVYLFLIVLIILLLIIAFLLYRIFVSNRILKEKFKEKEALVQEIHHRVKNNLQFVNSIINMQTNSLENNLEVTVLSETSRRIRSMALVHEMLYNKNNESGINMKQYLSELTKNIDDLVNTSRKKIDFLLDIDDLTFDVSKATAIGMIVSELASNSLKHAFELTEHPAIKIELKQRNSLNYGLIYTDNGVGLPEKYSKMNKIGMRLIDIFSRQIKGVYVFENQNGMTYKINFK